VTIERGDTVRWENSSGDFRAQDHTVKAYGGNWSKSTALPVGATTTKRFTDTGRFKFRCQLHSVMDNGVCEGMCGVVKVVRPS
jgi:plastocyanin